MVWVINTPKRVPTAKLLMTSFLRKSASMPKIFGRFCYWNVTSTLRVFGMPNFLKIASVVQVFVYVCSMVSGPIYVSATTTQSKIIELIMHMWVSIYGLNAMTIR